MKDKLRIFYVGDKSGIDKKGVLTIATQVNEDGKTFRVGFAFCSPKDRFSKKVGRAAAIGRLQNETLLVRFAGSMTDIGQINNFDFDDRTIDSVINIFNDRLVKPALWECRKLVNIPQAGLTYVDCR